MTIEVAIAVLAVGTLLLRTVAPLVLSRVSLSPTAEQVVALLPPALLAALIGVSTFTAGMAITLDERAAGVAVAVIAAWRRLPLPVIIAGAVAATAALRALSA